MSGKLIIGNNNIIPKGVDIVVLGVSGREFTEDDAGKVLLGENTTITATGQMEGTISPNGITVSSGDTTTAANKNYFCDATGGTFVLAITGALKEYNVVKIDATASVITIQPTSGLINGLASIDLTTQYEGKTIIYDGTNYYAF